LYRSDQSSAGLKFAADPGSVARNGNKALISG
jgi:hypothetical protein